MLSDSISDRTIVLLFLFVPSRKFLGFLVGHNLLLGIWIFRFSLFIFHLTVCSHKTNVPADLQSAEIKYKDFNPLTSYFY